MCFASETVMNHWESDGELGRTASFGPDFYLLLMFILLCKYNPLHLDVSAPVTFSQTNRIWNS